MKLKTRNLAFMSLLIACSYVGANIKVFGSIAFDSMPAFLGALLLGPVYGALIGAAGHFLTALTSGFPHSLPVHLITMLSMGVAVYLFGKLQNDILKNNNKWLGILLSVTTAVIFNGPVALLMVVPITGWGIFALLPFLLPTAAANVIAAELIYNAVPKTVKNRYRELGQWK